MSHGATAACCRLTIAVGLLILASLAPQRLSAAATSGPQSVVRQFCQADALGQRAGVQGWAALAPLVGWSFEPAWDEVVLIGGYAVGPPQAATDGVVNVDVRYDVLSTVSAEGVDASPRVETATFRLRTADAVLWRIDGPPLPPHILGPRVDVDIMRRSFQVGGVNFIADSLFIAQMYRSAGWDVGFKRVADLLDGTIYRSVDKARNGDLIVYLHDGMPYHVGLVEAENQIVSSTLNAGIVRTSTDAFVGDVKYLRLVRPAPDVAADAPTLDPTSAPPQLKPTMAAGAVLRHPGATPVRTPRRVQPPAGVHKRSRQKKLPVHAAQRAPQPSASRRAKKRVGKAATKPPVHPTPSAQPPVR